MFFYENERKFKLKHLILALMVAGLTACGSNDKDDNNDSDGDDFPFTVSIYEPYAKAIDIGGSSIKNISFDVEISSQSANLSLYADGQALIDNIDVVKKGQNKFNTLVVFEGSGEQKIELVARGGDITVNNLTLTDVGNLAIPTFTDASADIGLDIPEWNQDLPKYGGPTIADINNNGFYDFILNNHNWTPYTLLLWNDGQGNMEYHEKPIAMGDLHGTAVGDYNNSGLGDIVVTKGGGNGTTPTPPHFLKHIEERDLVDIPADVGLSDGGRGRAPRWMDLNGNGLLDLALFNALVTASDYEDVQHFFYENQGDGSFSRRAIPSIETTPTERVLVMDFDGDGIDDVLFIGPLRLFKGNGNFTFTDVTNTWIPSEVENGYQFQAAADVDVNNSGLPDLYLAAGLTDYLLSNKSMDFNPLTGVLDIDDNGEKGVTTITFEADGDIDLSEVHLTYRQYDGGFPLTLGEAKVEHQAHKGHSNDYYYIDDMTISPKDAMGWPADADRQDNAFYLGYLGDGQWRMEWRRNDPIFWNIAFRLSGIDNVTTEGWEPQNRNSQDYLLINTGEKFEIAENSWNIPQGGNHWGVTYGDFNNSGFNDIFVYRYGDLKDRLTDYLLINTGEDRFEITQIHGAHDDNDTGYGDMGQAFPFSRDGSVDMLNGSGDGKWYFYKNDNDSSNNHVLIHVGYSPKANLDPISAFVEVEMENGQKYRKRVGSAGEVFSQSLLNTMHFGLGQQENITEIKVTWRNGEVVYITDVVANERYTSDEADNPLPTGLSLPAESLVRETASIQLTPVFTPLNAINDVIWSSSDSEVVEVEDSGMIKGIREGGQATVTVRSTAVPEISASTVVTVVPYEAVAVESVSISPERPYIVVGETQQLEATVEPANADDKRVMWESSNTNVATVNENGLVTTLELGSAQITATTVDGGYTAIADVTVENPTPTHVTIDNNYFWNTDFSNNGPFSVTVNYHAGSGATVSGGNYGGMMFRLREMTSDWSTVVNDYTAVNSEVIGTVEGTVTQVIDLDNITPSAELPEGNFYFLLVEMSSSNGEVADPGVSPIKIVENAAARLAPHLMHLFSCQHEH